MRAERSWKVCMLYRSLIIIHSRSSPISQRYMILQNEVAAIHLRQNSRVPNMAYQAAGLAVLLCCVLGMTVPLKGEAIELFFPGIALFSLVLAKLAERSSRRHFAILYPDRFEFPGFPGTEKTIHWNQVTSLRWSGSSDERRRLIVYTKERETPLGFFVMNLADIVPEDCLTFIRYVRRAAIDIPQERWAGFCRQIAVPLLKKVEKTEVNDTDDNPQPCTIRERVVLRSLAFCGYHPFLAGLFMPVFWVLALPLLISRATSWVIAALIAISGIINIRLVWGAWIEPFTTTVWGTAAAFFALGVFSFPRRPENRNPNGALGVAKVLGYLALLVVGVPLAMNALVKGWLPRNLAMPLKWVVLTLFLLPVFVIPWSQRRNDKQSLEDLEREALRYWDEREQLICKE